MTKFVAALSSLLLLLIQLDCSEGLALFSTKPPIRRTLTLWAQSQPSSSTSTPRLSQQTLQQLDNQGYAIIQNFIPQNLIDNLRADVLQLRSAGRFKIAGVGQDNSNAVVDSIRRAETCFINDNNHADIKSDARNQLYTILNQARLDLSQHCSSRGISRLDAKLDELLYAYYPLGGYYKRHIDAVSYSPSYLRQYSFLLYLNASDWDIANLGGALRIYLENNENKSEHDHIDVPPCGGTMLVFDSANIPHQVMDTAAERMAVVGWYNRAVTPADIPLISPQQDGLPRTAMLVVAAALVTVGLAQIIATL